MTTSQARLSPASVSIVCATKNARELTSQEIEELIERVTKRRPMAMEPITNVTEDQKARAALGGSIEMPTQVQFERYQQIEYPGWVNALREWLQSYPKYRNQKFRVTTIDLDLTNVGPCPADGLRFEIRATGGASLLPDRQDIPA